MNLARRDWDNRRIYDVRKRLATYLDPDSGGSDLRGFEWNYLWKLCDHGTVTLSGHDARVTSISYSPDGSTLAVGDQSGAIKTLGPGAPASPARCCGATPRRSVRSLSFPMARRLASGSEDGTVRIWEAATGRCERNLSLEQPVMGIAISPDGKILATTTIREDEVTLFDLGGDGPPVVLIPPAPETISPPLRFDLFVSDVKFLPDGTRLYATDYRGHGLNVWDVKGRRRVPGLSVDKIFSRVDITGDGQKLVTLTQQQHLQVWDIGNSSPTDFPPVRIFGVNYGGHVACGNSEHLFAYSSPVTQITELWDIDGRHKIDDYPPGQDIRSRCLAFRPDSRRLAIARGDQVTISKIPTPRESVPDLVSAPDAKISSLAVRADGTGLIWAVDGKPTITLASMSGWQPINRALEGNATGIMALACGPSARPELVASAGIDGTILVWDTSTDAPPLSLIGHLGVVADVAFSLDGRSLVTAGADGTIRAWDIATDRALWVVDGASGPLQSLALTPDGRRLATVGGDGSVFVRDSGTGRPLVGPLAARWHWQRRRVQPGWIDRRRGGGGPRRWRLRRNLERVDRRIPESVAAYRSRVVSGLLARRPARDHRRTPGADRRLGRRHRS